MRALVVYESMFGNTHAVAEGVAASLAGGTGCRAALLRELRLELS